MADGNDPKQAIINLMARTKPQSGDGVSSAPTVSNVVSFTGTGNIASGNIVAGDINLTVNHAPKSRVIVQTANGTIDAAQKARIKDKVTRYVDACNALEPGSMSYQAAWSALNRKMKVNSYHELRPDQVPAAMKWLRTQTGRVQSMAGAPDRDPNFRTDAIRFIKARCRQLGDPDLYRARALEAFGSSSLADLDNVELQAIRQWVAQKKG
ncbi:hypothetical protein [Nioella sp.]|uniref:hypothetical protein n=1 Tax=Nioella sp. TaxID=1912091 RepID=UPI0035180426